MKVRVNKRISDSDTKSLFDDIDVVMSVFGDIHVSRFYSDDNNVTLVADYDVWSDNARQIKQEMKNLGYSMINAGGNGDKIMLDFQKRVSDSRKRVKDSAVHSEEVFEKIKGLFEDEISIRHLSDDFIEVDYHDGSSYDGFISFCDGWVETIASVIPSPFLSGSSLWTKSEKCNKIVENLEDQGGILDEIYEYSKDYKDRYTTAEEFKEAYHSTEMEDYEEVDEELVDWYYEAPAYIKVRLLLNGNHAKLSSFFNDDLGYGRESVGSWAGKNSIGEHIGDHVIEEYETDFENYDELYAFVEENLPKVLDSFEIYS